MYVSRAPAALPESGGGLICHESAGTNYQQALSDRTPNNRDNPGLLMKPKPLLDAGLSYQISHIYQTFSFVMQHYSPPPLLHGAVVWKSSAVNVALSPRRAHVSTSCTSVGNLSPRLSARWPAHRGLSVVITSRKQHGVNLQHHPPPADKDSRDKRSAFVLVPCTSSSPLPIRL